MTTSAADRTGHEKWLIYCPEISPDTLLHLSIQGTSYALRNYLGATPGSRFSAPIGQAFKGCDAVGGVITTTDAFKKAFAFEWKVDVYDQGVALTKLDRWRDIILRHNFRLKIGL